MSDRDYQGQTPFEKAVLHRLAGIERNMVTQAGLETFMRTTFGQMLSDYRIQRGLDSMSDTQREQRAEAAG